MLWELDPVIVRFTAGIDLRYFSFLATLAYGLAAVAAGWFTERAGIAPKRVTQMLLFTALAAALGGHAAHLVLFEPEGLRAPMRIAALGSGQSSHGAVVAALVVLFIFARAYREDPRVYFDSWVSGAVFAIPFIRIGNLTNSEIVGRVSDALWAMRFPRYDCPEIAFDASLGGTCDAPLRHPWPLYDALDGIWLIVLALALRKSAMERRPGSIFLVLWTCWFGARFVLGFFAERTGSLDLLGLTTDQLASVGTLAAGVLLAWVAGAFGRPPA